ncbi:protein DSF2 [Diplogelasinospora grovesii]|uniref:Protein DSF2 n=1 Tax=Diplogelasinospora grovesii TaxID=303347 RepID=A0AAN6NDW4_9PEZI|nr:protein DSF2 [Diplogelasinospora grovesii]
MSTPRQPDFIDVRSKSQASFSRPLRSPRLHVAGEAPPELSPLDAFAMQSRMLAKQLEESRRQGRRMSRLPPLTTESPLIVQARSEYFRSLSHDSGSEDGDFGSPQNVGLGLKTEVQDDLSNRPVSMHPRMSRIPPTPDESIPLPARPTMDDLRERHLSGIEESENYFGVGARREESPTPMESNPSSDPRPESRTARQDSVAQPSPVSSHFMSNSPDKLYKKNSFESGGLVPPRTLFPKRSSSIMSSPLEPTDEEGVSSLSTSFHSYNSRKLSTSNGMVSPGVGAYQRSPSISSEASGLPRPSFNFSRPLSRAGTPGLDRVGTPSLEPPARQASSDSQASFILADDTACTPISMHSEGFPDVSTNDGKPAAPSYIYSKFTLPRGKALQRQSANLLDDQPSPRFSWEEPCTLLPSNAQTYPIAGQPPPSPPTRPSSAAGPHLFEEPVPQPSLERSKLSIEVLRPAQQPSPDPSRPSTDGARQSEDVPRGRPLTSLIHDSSRGRTPMSTTTSDSASTIKAARSQHSFAPTMSDMSAEEHVNKAIVLHEKGSLNESTWHLRHAAKAGHPTGMLLYALACRHGWGMRANQREGVEWLRKAAESVSLEIADDEGHAKEGKAIDVGENKTRKAQFALSVYELGVSHMNGWGIEQDKALALRCFEIAGSWGDVDALAEAGFCYAQGVGCKKDLKKSAKFYREAEAKGMSMVGNSWIHKSKYDDDGKDEKKARSKSRSRKGLFGRKTSNTSS